MDLERNLIIESTDPGHNEKELPVTEENTSEHHMSSTIGFYVV